MAEFWSMRRNVGAASPSSGYRARLLVDVRDTVQISRGEATVEPLIFTAILDANMVPELRPDLAVTYGGAEISATDHLRRPVSINAVAQSAQLPFETVRRR